MRGIVCRVQTGVSQEIIGGNGHGETPTPSANHNKANAPTGVDTALLLILDLPVLLADKRLIVHEDII